MAPIKPGDKSTRTIPDGKAQVNFNVSSSLLYKVKYIVLQEGGSNSDVYNKAVEEYVERWEKDNGKIKVPKSKG